MIGGSRRYGEKGTELKRLMLSIEMPKGYILMEPRYSQVNVRSRATKGVRRPSYLKSLPNLVENLFFVGLGAAMPPAFCSTWNLGAMTVSRRISWGCLGVASSMFMLAKEVPASVAVSFSRMLVSGEDDADFRLLCGSDRECRCRLLMLWVYVLALPLVVAVAFVP